MRAPQQYLEALVELTVGFGANVQPGQVVSIDAETGLEPYARAVADAAYKRGARFVDVWYFDPHVKHSRLKHADRETLSYVPRIILVGLAIVVFSRSFSARMICALACSIEWVVAFRLLAACR